MADEDIREECKCKPLNDEILFTGNCPIHQAVPTVSLEGLENSARNGNPEAKAFLRLLHRQSIKAQIEALEDITKTSSVLTIHGAKQPVDVVGVHVINSQIQQLKKELESR